MVGGGGPGSSIWRRERVVMGDADLDDVAFLTGRKLSRMYYKCEKGSSIQTRNGFNCVGNLFFIQ